MATRRAPAKRGIGSAIAGEPVRPTPEQVAEAIERWRHAALVASNARDAETEARTALVDVLHRAGLRGFSL